MLRPRARCAVAGGCAGGTACGIAAAAHTGAGDAARPTAATAPADASVVGLDGPALYARLCNVHLRGERDGPAAATQLCQTAAEWLHTFCPRAAAWLRDGGKPAPFVAARTPSARTERSKRGAAVAPVHARTELVLAFAKVCASDPYDGPATGNTALTVALLPFFLPQHVMAGALDINGAYPFFGATRDPRAPEWYTPLQYACARGHTFAVQALCDPLVADPLLLGGGVPLDANITATAASVPLSAAVVAVIHRESPLQLLLRAGDVWRDHALPAAVDVLLSRCTADTIRGGGGGVTAAAAVPAATSDGFDAAATDAELVPPLWLCAEQCLADSIDAFDRSQVGVWTFQLFLKRHDDTTDDGPVDLLQPRYSQPNSAAELHAAAEAKVTGRPPPPATVVGLIERSVLARRKLHPQSFAHVNDLLTELRPKCARIGAYRTRARVVVAHALDRAGVSVTALIALVTDYAVRPSPALAS